MVNDDTFCDAMEEIRAEISNLTGSVRELAEVIKDLKGEKDETG